MTRESPIKKLTQRIGEILVQKGWLSDEDLHHALLLQKTTGVRKIGEILNTMGWLTEEQLSEALAAQFQLKYLDLANLPAGWSLWRESFTAQCKRLKILPLRDPAQKAWLVISERTPDETLHLHAEGLFDISSILFAVAPSTSQTQALEEHLAWDEASEGPATQTVVYPAAPDWLRALMGTAGSARVTLPPEARKSLELPETCKDLSGEQALKAARAAALELRRHVPAALLTLPLQRTLSAVGGLWGQSPVELRRVTRIALSSGPSLKIEIVPPATPAAPARPVNHHGLPATRPRSIPIEVHVTLPWFSVDEGAPDATWPRPWPPADLSGRLPALLGGLCRISGSLKTSETSLRWMGQDTAARRKLNHLTLRSIGASVEEGRVDDTQELWDALLARVRRLEANHVVSQDWARWQGASCSALDIEPGGLLCLAAVLLDRPPLDLNVGLSLEFARGGGPSLCIEISVGGNGSGSRTAAGAEGIAMKVTLPELTDRA